MEANFLESTRKLFTYYRELGDKSIAQCNFEELMSAPDEQNNSIAIVVKHMAGNMRSRWTNFLTEDGEKSWRNRDQEFEVAYESKDDILADWNSGWDCLFSAINPLKPEDVGKIIYIRNQGHTVLEAMQRQLGHYSYHVGQIVFKAKIIRGEDWQSLSIPKGKSSDYNAKKFSQDKKRGHFTEDA